MPSCFGFLIVDRTSVFTDLDYNTNGKKVHAFLFKARRKDI